MNETKKPKKKICPLMSDGNREIRCSEHECMFWIQVYTTENLTEYGCAHALQPCMTDGKLRV